QNRREGEAKRKRRSAIPAGGINGMMEEAHLPGGLRGRQPLIEPAQLPAIEIRRVEREKLGARRQPRQQILGWCEAVVPLPSHIELLIGGLPRIVVIAERSEKLD